MDIHDGDECYYLSIGGQNNWYEAHALQGIYKANNYHACTVSRIKKEIDDLAVEIKDLFKDENIDSSKLATDCSRNYFHVVLNYPSDTYTIGCREDDGSSLEDQKKYHNNYFNDEEYAIKIANKICACLGISQTVMKHPK